MIASAAAWTTQGLVRMQDDRDRFAVRFTHLVCPGRSRRSRRTPDRCVPFAWTVVACRIAVAVHRPAADTWSRVLGTSLTRVWVCLVWRTRSLPSTLRPKR
jgi:hypothetical protein